MSRKHASRAWIALAGALLAGHALAASLYDEKTFRPLTADNKAFRVGDLITVQVVESASASTDSDTTTRRTNNLSASLSHGVARVTSAEAAVAGQFDGGGHTERNGKLVAQVSVSVRQVLPNGEMLIAGEQQLRLNDELQRIQLDGRVRPQDISDGNVVLSTRIADAHIVYHGEGDVTERQRRAWWRKLGDWLGL